MRNQACLYGSKHCTMDYISLYKGGEELDISMQVW